LGLDQVKKKGEKPMKKLLAILLGASFAFTSGMTSVAWAINIRFNVMYSQKHPLCREAFVPWAKQVSDVTNSRVKVTMFYSNALFKPKQAYDAVASRAADMGLVLPTYSRNRFLVSGVMDLPMVGGAKAQISSEVLWEMYQAFPEIQSDFKDVKVLWVYMNPAFELHFTKKKVRNLEELKNTVVSAGGTVNAEIMRDLGASVESIPMVEVYLALQKGVVEGCFLPYAPLRTQRIADLIHYHTNADLMAASFFVVMNKDAWAGISPEDQKAIEGISGMKAAALVGSVFDKSQSKDIEWMTKKGDEFFTLNPAEREKWAKRIMPIRDEWVKDVKAKGINGERILDAALKRMAEKSR
jgi:TRAP-type C4-dicarboxylate transport system substrate-binding protein